jgi:hypothetical protein
MDPILDYIKKARESGKTDAEIRQDLVQAGWQEYYIDQAFKTRTSTIRKPLLQRLWYTFKALLIATIVLFVMFVIWGVYLNHTDNEIQPESSTPVKKVLLTLPQGYKPEYLLADAYNFLIGYKYGFFISEDRSLAVLSLPYDIERKKSSILINDRLLTGSYDLFRGDQLPFFDNKDRYVFVERVGAGVIHNDSLKYYPREYVHIGDKILGPYTNIFKIFKTNDGEVFFFATVKKSLAKQRWKIDETKYFVYLDNAETEFIMPGRDMSLLEEVNVSRIHVSPDGRNLITYVTDSNSSRGNGFYFANGKKEKTYEAVSGFTFSKDYRHYGYYGRISKNQYAVIIDGVEVRSFETDRPVVFPSGFPEFMNLNFTDDNKPVYLVDTGKNENSKCGSNVSTLTVIIGNNEGKYYDEISNLVVDGNSVAYQTLSTVQSNDSNADCSNLEPRMSIVYNEEERFLYNFSNLDIQYIGWQFSHDGKRLAIVEARGLKDAIPDRKILYTVVVAENGLKDSVSLTKEPYEGSSYDRVFNLYFTPDGTHLIYSARDIGEGFVGNPTTLVINNEEIKVTDNRPKYLSEREDKNLTTFSVSPDSNHWIYTYRHMNYIASSTPSDSRPQLNLEGKEIDFAILDGKIISKRFDAMLTCEFSLDSTKLIITYIYDGKVWYEEIPIDSLLPSVTKKSQ